MTCKPAEEVHTPSEVVVEKPNKRDGKGVEEER